MPYGISPGFVDPGTGFLLLVPPELESLGNPCASAIRLSLLAAPLSALNWVPLREGVDPVPIDFPLAIH